MVKSVQFFFTNLSIFLSTPGNGLGAVKLEEREGGGREGKEERGKGRREREGGRWNDICDTLHTDKIITNELLQI